MNRLRLKTRNVANQDDRKSFFDGIAASYTDSHGQSQKLLRYRVSLIKQLMGYESGGVLLEIGCGTGIHLFELTDCFNKIIGTDLSPAMIAAAETVRVKHPRRDDIRLLVDPAEQLNNILDDKVDLVLCVGALEHMLDKTRVLLQVKRVLKAGGTFICLTPNANFFWYRWLAPLLDIDTRHLSTDRFLNRAEITALLDEVGLTTQFVGLWRFIPRGDMRDCMASLLVIADIIGRYLNIWWLRGGIYFKAVKSG